MAREMQGASRLGRPRKVEDDDVFRAFVAVLQRVGWARVTVSLLAREVGVTPAALRQRFGGKRELLVRAYAWGIHELQGRRDDGAAAPLSWWDRVRALVTTPAVDIATPSEMLNVISTFAVVTTDPELHELVHTHFRVALERTNQLIHEGVAAGELRDVDESALSRQLQATLMGTALFWSVAPEGSIADHLMAATGALLAPYVATSAPDWVRGVADPGRPHTKEDTIDG